MGLSAAVVMEIERLGGRATGGDIFGVEWPKGVTYRTTADDRADREVSWLAFGGKRAMGASHAAFGTSHGGKMLVGVSMDEEQAPDPVVWLAKEKEAPAATHRLSIFLASLEREPTRKRR